MRKFFLTMTFIAIIFPLIFYIEDNFFAEKILPSTRGVSVNNNAVIDYSNDGFVKIKFLHETDACVRVIITGESNVPQQYRLNTSGEWEAFPLFDGNGQYTIGIFRQVSENRFATAHTATINVRMKNEFSPFLQPNQIVNFCEESAAVLKATELTHDSKSEMESVRRIFNFITENISYDFELAENVRSGYVPNIDAVLERGKGICFDYAALMTAMLRSREIPTKLVVGYANTEFHAWISVYSEKSGWLNNIIFFNGASWNLVDPTFAASNSRATNIKYNAMYFH
jgi:hypothetical protein